MRTVIQKCNSFVHLIRVSTCCKNLVFSALGTSAYMKTLYLKLGKGRQCHILVATLWCIFFRLTSGFVNLRIVMSTEAKNSVTLTIV